MTSLDTWLPVRGRTDVVFILREMYSSVVICVCNRSSSQIQVICDCSKSTNALLICSEPQRIPNTNLSLRHVVSSGQTAVVGLLSPLTSTLPIAASVAISVIPLTSLPSRSQVLFDTSKTIEKDDETFHPSVEEERAVLGAAESSSSQVAQWLAERRKITVQKDLL